MLSATLDLIDLVASNSLLVFCFCNILIALLLVSSFNSGNSSSGGFDEEKPLPLPADEERTKRSIGHCTENVTRVQIEADSGDQVHSVSAVMELTDQSREASSAVMELTDQRREPSSSAVDVVVVVSNGAESCKEEDDEELRRRFEEFIEKTKRGWKLDKFKKVS